MTVNGDSDGMGIFSAMNASAAHYSKDANINLMTTTVHSDNCTYCHFINNGSNAWLTPKKPLTSVHSSYSNDTPPSTCWGCHVDSPVSHPHSMYRRSTKRRIRPELQELSYISDTSTNQGHIDIAVFNTSIHGNMNTTGGTDLNEPCWGCHGNGNSEGHNSTGDAYGKGLYRNPYNCTDCHVPMGIRYAWAAARNAMTVQNITQTVQISGHPTTQQWFSHVLNATRILARCVFPAVIRISTGLCGHPAGINTIQPSAGTTAHTTMEKTALTFAPGSIRHALTVIRTCHRYFRLQPPT